MRWACHMKGLVGYFFFFLYEWEHRKGTMCPFSSLHPIRNGKGCEKTKIYKISKKVIKKMPSGP